MSWCLPELQLLRCLFPLSWQSWEEEWTHVAESAVPQTGLILAWEGADTSGLPLN